MYHQIILATLWVSVYVSVSATASDGTASDGVGAVDGNKEICEAPECQELADMMREQMGGKPCEDYYNYVCRNWEGDRELKRRLLKKKAVRVLMYLLGNASKPLSENLNATDKLILSYSSCTTKGGDKKALKDSVNRVLAEYKLAKKTWPIIEEASLRKNITTYQDILNRAGPRPVFSYSISLQQNGPVIVMSKPSHFYMAAIPDLSSRNADVEDGSTDYNYTDYDTREDESYKTFIAKSAVLLNASVKEEDAKKIAEDIAAFEKELSKLATEAHEAEEKKMSLSQLDKKLAINSSMARILRKDFGGLNINITRGTNVLVQYIDYYEGAVNLMKCTPLVTLSNYILWTHIRKMAEAEGTDLHKIYLEYKHNTSIFRSTDEEYNFEAEHASITKNLSLHCVHRLLGSDMMYTAAAYYYITAKFNKIFQDDVLEIMKFVNSSFLRIVKNNTWMTDSTKEAVIAKLQNTTAIIGYPDWMLNETIIDSLYQFVPNISENASFVEYFHYLLENNHKQTLLQLVPDRYFNRENERIPLRSHAYYDKETQTIVYPAASLVTHYRSSPIPRSVNYGTIGTILSQLFIAIIDRYSSLSEETGRYDKSTWDTQTRDNFCNRSSCLNRTEECNDTSVPPISEKFEKLHDYYGVRISFQAMENDKNYTSALIKENEEKTYYTKEELFFIAFGSLYCPFSVNEKLVQSRTDEEENFPKSLNEIVYNYPDFNKTFKCEPMTKDLCDLMPPEPGNPYGC